MPSLKNLAVGYLLTLLIGISAGTALGLLPSFEEVVRPIVEFLRSVPGITLLPLMVVALGLGDSMRVGTIVIAAVWPTLLNTINGVRSVDLVVQDVARSLRLSRGKRLRRVVLPAAAPQIFAGARTSLSIAVVVMVVTEFCRRHRRNRVFPAQSGARLRHRVHVGHDHSAGPARLHPQLRVPGCRGADHPVASRAQRAGQKGNGVTQISSSRDDRVVLRAEALGHRYGDNVALGHIDFTVCKGEIVCVVGPSGVGKTTMLRCLAGLQRPTSGTVTCAGHPVESPPTEMAVVFQDYSRWLMPWLRVTANITLALSNEKIGRARKKEMAAETLATVGLEGVGSSYPWQLSGGMQQRVAIARALVGRLAIVLIDEPFASVDAQTRADLEDRVIDLRARLGVTVLLVTHDIDEAVYLGGYALKEQ